MNQIFRLPITTATVRRSALLLSANTNSIKFNPSLRPLFQNLSSSQSQSKKSFATVKISSSQDLQDLQEKLKLAKPENKFSLSVLYFTAQWCGPCQRVAPVIEDELTGDGGFMATAIKTYYGDESRDTNIPIYKIDIDQNGDLARQYQIQAVPTFIINCLTLTSGQKSKELKRFTGSDPGALKMAVEEGIYEVKRMVKNGEIWWLRLEAEEDGIIKEFGNLNLS